MAKWITSLKVAFWGWEWYPTGPLGLFGVLTQWLPVGKLFLSTTRLDFLMLIPSDFSSSREKVFSLPSFRGSLQLLESPKPSWGDLGSPSTVASEEEAGLGRGSSKFFFFFFFFSGVFICFSFVCLCLFQVFFPFFQVFLESCAFYVLSSSGRFLIDFLMLSKWFIVLMVLVQALCPKKVGIWWTTWHLWPYPMIGRCFRV